MLKLLAPLLVPPVLNRALRLQKELGYKLGFADLPPEWLNGGVLVDMTATWQGYGLPIRGTNWFTLGAVQNGVSTRFVSGDRLYQAWLGGYVFTSQAPLDWTPTQYLRVAEADQKKWLRYYGVPEPQMDFGAPHSEGTIKIDGVAGQLYSWSGETQSDVGPRAGRFYNRAVMDGMAWIMNRLSPGLHVCGRQFISTATAKPYEPLTIGGYIAIMDLGSDTKALLYVCMTKPNAGDMRVMRDLITRHITVEPMMSKEL